MAVAPGGGYGDGCAAAFGFVVAGAAAAGTNQFGCNPIAHQSPGFGRGFFFTPTLTEGRVGFMLTLLLQMCRASAPREVSKPCTAPSPVPLLTPFEYRLMRDHVEIIPLPLKRHSTVIQLD